MNAMTNAERQALYKQRLRERAENGVTPEMVLRAAEGFWNASRRDDPDLPPFSERIAECRTIKGRKLWWDDFEQMSRLADDEDTREWLGKDADLILKVAAVLRVAVEPPRLIVKGLNA